MSAYKIPADLARKVRYPVPSDDVGLSMFFEVAITKGRLANGISVKVCDYENGGAIIRAKLSPRRAGRLKRHWQRWGFPMDEYSLEEAFSVGTMAGIRMELGLYKSVGKQEVSA